ncbi:lipooligosaccharide transport system permease protein [Micrococcus luteus]|uniref:Transport permease protein n=1 Tax=Micrococcus luteus TaxID=1270 RepID=A0ABD7M6J6_MICLU|nr:ABC transporter permease [Micrococcus luteus]TPE35372.1 ABC transporter [Micrococcus luteus]SHL39345.1 lipooligosaccharide transport system permease protein [Micrococcus luteus]
MPSPTTTTAPGPATPAEPLRPPVTAAESAERVRRRGVLLYAEHQLRSMRRYGAVLLVGALGEPVLYLLAMGLGLAQLMGGGMPQDALGGVSYVAFIAPALLASGALMTASVEFSYPVMGGFQWQRTYYAAQATPLSPAQIALGHLVAVSLRFVFQATVFLLVMLAFGVVSSPWAWVQVLTATLGGLAVGAPIMAFAASLKEDKGQFATLQRLVVMPLFLFSATFYPLEALPVWLRWIGWLSPQWHAAQLGRVLSYGMAEPVWLTVVHVAFLLVLALGGAWLAVRIYTRRLGWVRGTPDRDAGTAARRDRAPRLGRRAARTGAARADVAPAAAQAEPAAPSSSVVREHAVAVPPMPEIPVRRGPLAGAYSGNVRAVMERAFLSLKSNNWVVFFSGFFEPVLYLASMGLGLGALVGDVAGPDGTPIPYGMYLAPALLAVSAMNGAIYDSTWNVFFKLRYAKTYQTMLSTRLGPLDVALGEIAMALLRGLIYAVGFLIVMTVAGLVTSWTALLMIPGALLVALGFASLGMAVTSWMKTFQHMDWVQIVLMPMFLFSATFFPLAVYPEPIQWVIRVFPLWHAVEMMRALAVGVLSWATAGHVLYFVVMAGVGVWLAARRLGALFLR